MTRVRIRKQWCAALVLLLGSGLSTKAHLGDRVYPIPYLSDEMLERIDLKDGLVDEWYELVGEPSMTLLDFTGEEPHSPPLLPDPSDLDFRTWLAWHDDPARLYVAFVASDDVYENTHDYSSSPLLHLHDSIMLAVDGDHSGGAGAGNSTPPEEAIEIRGQTQEYEAISRTAGGPTLNDTERGCERRGPETRGGSHETPFESEQEGPSCHRGGGHARGRCGLLGRTWRFALRWVYQL